MGTRSVAGREFSERDANDTTPVAIISETADHRYWPHSNPVGGHFSVLARVYSGQYEATTPLEIVGIVKDVRNGDLWNPEADVYLPFQQHPASSVFLVVRAAGAPMGLVPAIHSTVLALDKEQPVNNVRTVSDIVSQTYGTMRISPIKAIRYD